MHVGLAVSLILIAVGAVLAIAVKAETRNLDITATGVILVIVGLGGVLTSLVLGTGDGRRSFPRLGRGKGNPEDGSRDPQVTEDDSSH